jgi:hypothetical protein
MRGVQIIRSSSPEVLDVVDVPESAAGSNVAATHHALSWHVPRQARRGPATTPAE